MSSFTINDGGHTWRDHLYRKGSPGKASQEIDATELMWEFFQEFSLEP